MVDEGDDDVDEGGGAPVVIGERDDDVFSGVRLHAMFRGSGTGAGVVWGLGCPRPHAPVWLAATEGPEGLRTAAATS